MFGFKQATINKNIKQQFANFKSVAETVIFFVNIPDTWNNLGKK